MNFDIDAEYSRRVLESHERLAVERQRNLALRQENAQCALELMKFREHLMKKERIILEQIDSLKMSLQSFDERGKFLTNLEANLQEETRKFELKESAFNTERLRLNENNLQNKRDAKYLNDVSELVSHMHSHRWCILCDENTLRSQISSAFFSELQAIVSEQVLVQAKASILVDCEEKFKQRVETLTANIHRLMDEKQSELFTQENRLQKVVKRNEALLRSTISSKKTFIELLHKVRESLSFDESFLHDQVLTSEEARKLLKDLKNHVTRYEITHPILRDSLESLQLLLDQSNAKGDDVDLKWWSQFAECSDLVVSLVKDQFQFSIN